MTKTLRKLRERTLQKLYPDARRLPSWEDAVSDERDRLFETVLLQWWYEEARTSNIAYFLADSPLKVRVLAAAVATLAVEHLCKDPVRDALFERTVAWARSEVDDAEFQRAREPMSDRFLAEQVYPHWELRLLLRDTALGDVVATVSKTAHLFALQRPDRNEVYIEALALLAEPMRLLFPDPSKVALGDALLRHSDAAACARGLFRKL